MQETKNPAQGRGRYEFDSLQGTADGLETRMNAGFHVFDLEKYRQKYRHL